jgi:phosphocarrier protein
MKVSLPLTVINRLGLHARASSAFVQTASRFQATITVTHEGTEKTADGKSIMGVMMLAAPCGTTLEVTCEGVDAEAAAEALAALLEDRFGEPD